MLQKDKKADNKRKRINALQIIAPGFFGLFLLGGMLLTLPVFNADGEWNGKSLLELNVRNTYGFNVVGIKKNNTMEIQISPQEPLDKNMILYIIGKNEDLEKFQK